MTPRKFLEKFRQGERKPVYFFVGEEAFLHEKCRRELLLAVPEEARAWCVHWIEIKSGELAVALEQACQMPMVGSHNLMFISDPSNFTYYTESDYDAFKEYLDRPPDFSTLVFSAQATDRRRRFTTLLFKRAEVVEMRRPKPAEIVRWVGALLRDRGIRVEQEAAEALTEQFGGNLLWIYTELEKLQLSRPELKQVTLKDLQVLVSLAEDHEISRLLRALAERNTSEALLRLENLLKSNEPELRLLWHIGHLFRCALIAAGDRVRSVGYRGRESENLAQRVAENYTYWERLQALQWIHEADLEIKSAWQDTQLRIESLIWKLVGSGVPKKFSKPKNRTQWGSLKRV